MNTAVETEIARHLHVLCEEIGCRPIGSSANRKAAAYIASVFRSAGLETEELSFQCPDWRDEGTLLEVDGRPLAAHANAFSPSCSEEAPGILVGTEALTGEVGRLLHGFPGMHWTEPWPQSNHSSFAFRGVPAVALSSGAWEVAHRPEDSLEQASPAKLSEAAFFVAGLACSLAGRLLEWTRPPG